MPHPEQSHCDHRLNIRHHNCKCHIADTCRKEHIVLIAQRPTLTEEKIAEFRCRFVIEPLEPGFGYTLGNSLRRSLLSSIPGAAVTSIRIDGVLHEFSTIPGVKEDVTEIILNIKRLVVSSEHDEPITAYLRKQARARSPRRTSRLRPVSRCTTPSSSSRR